MHTLTLTDEILQAFGRNIDAYGLRPQAVYLDKETGEVIELYDAFDSPFEPEEDEALRQLVEESPGRYLQIPGVGILTRHAILLDFLDSDEFAEEMGDEVARKEATERYVANQSIRDWLSTVDEPVRYAFAAFKDEQVKDMASDFLRENGIEVE